MQQNRSLMLDMIIEKSSEYAIKRAFEPISIEAFKKAIEKAEENRNKVGHYDHTNIAECLGHSFVEQKSKFNDIIYGKGKSWELLRDGLVPKEGKDVSR